MDANDKPVYEGKPLLGDAEEGEKERVGEGEKKSDMFWSTFNLANNIVGVGLLAAPHYLAQGGVGAVCTLIIFITLISDYTLRKLNSISVAYKQENFVELCDIAYGKMGYFLACLFMFVYNFGAAVANLMVIGTAIPELLSFVLEEDHFLLQREYVLLLSVILFLPVSFFKDIKDYAICSFIAVVGVIAVVLVVFFRPLLPPHLDDLPAVPPADAYMFLKADMVHVLGGISFIFVCHDFSISISSSLQNPTPARWAIVVRASLLIGVLCTLCIGFAGYVTFWNDVSQNILDNYPSHDIAATVARSLICLGIIVSVPYNVVMPRLAIRQLIELAWKPEEGSDDLFHIIITLVVLSCELLVAITVTDLGNLFEFVGGFASAGLAFILPPLVYIKLERGSLLETPSKIAMLLITLFGVFTLVTSSSTTVRRVWTVGE